MNLFQLGDPVIAAAQPHPPAQPHRPAGAHPTSTDGDSAGPHSTAGRSGRPGPAPTRPGSTLGADAGAWPAARTRPTAARCPARRVRVMVQGGDPDEVASLRALVRRSPDLVLIGAGDVLAGAGDPQVRVVTTTGRLEARPGPDAPATPDRTPTVLIGEVSRADLLPVLDRGALAVLPISEVNAERLGRVVRAVLAGNAVLPPDLVGEMVRHIRWLRPDAAAPGGPAGGGAGGARPGREALSAREVEVLRLMADGLDTREIAGRLHYSERTVKNMIHAVTHRLDLRNRSHAVAYALRSGAI